MNIDILLGMIIGLAISLTVFLIGSIKRRILSEDIIQLPNGYFAPVVNGSYIWIGTGGETSYHSTLCIYNCFKTKEEAKNFLEKWKSYRGIGSKSVGVD